MSGLEIGAALARWAEIVGLATVVGALALDALVLPWNAPALEASRRRLRRWVLTAIVVLAVAAMAALGVRAQAMTQGTPAATVAAVPEVLRRTHFGAVWLLRGALLGGLLAASLGRSRIRRGAALAFAVAVAITTALTGHAATWGDATLAVAVDAIHVVAASAWTGGLLLLALMLTRDPATVPGPTLARIARRFSTLAAGCLVAVVLSGGYNAIVQIGSPAALVATAYGRVLIAKLLVFVGLVWLGALNRFRVVPALTRERGMGEATARFARYVGGEALLALLVFACTAVLGELTPGRHAAHLSGHGYHEEGRHGDHGR